MSLYFWLCKVFCVLMFAFVRFACAFVYCLFWLFTVFGLLDAVVLLVTAWLFVYLVFCVLFWWFLGFVVWFSVVSGFCWFDVVCFGSLVPNGCVWFVVFGLRWYLCLFVFVFSGLLFCLILVFWCLGFVLHCALLIYLFAAVLCLWWFLVCVF